MEEYTYTANRMGLNRYEGLRPLVRLAGGVYISTAEGRVLQTGASIDLNTGKVLKDFRYEYYLKDHLGNVRFLFTDVDGDGVPEILQEDAYDPWGVRLAGLSYTQGERNGFLYNGKEQVKGLGWYDYGARMYDPATGRWNGVDGLAEKYIGISPYVYCADNPVLFLDVDGGEFYIGIYDPNTKTTAIYGVNAQNVAENHKALYNKALEAYNYVSSTTNEDAKSMLENMSGSNTKYLLRIGDPDTKDEFTKGLTVFDAQGNSGNVQGEQYYLTDFALNTDKVFKKSGVTTGRQSAAVANLGHGLGHLWEQSFVLSENAGSESLPYVNYGEFISFYYNKENSSYQIGSTSKNPATNIKLFEEKVLNPRFGGRIKEAIAVKVQNNIAKGLPNEGEQQIGPDGLGKTNFSYDEVPAAPIPKIIPK